MFMFIFTTAIDLCTSAKANIARPFKNLKLSDLQTNIEYSPGILHKRPWILPPLGPFLFVYDYKKNSNVYRENVSEIQSTGLI